MSKTNEISARIGKLEGELRNAIRHYACYARLNYWFAHILMGVTLVSSALATFLGVVLNASGKVTGIVAVIPGITALIAVTIKPAGRANWHYRKKDELNALRQRLLYQLPESPTADNVAAISSSWSELTTKMNKEWEHEFTLTWASFNHRGH